MPSQRKIGDPVFLISNIYKFPPLKLHRFQVRATYVSQNCDDLKGVFRSYEQIKLPSKYYGLPQMNTMTACKGC